jgi:hypothetical protein
VCVCAGRAGREEEEEDNSNHTPHLWAKFLQRWVGILNF